MDKEINATAVHQVLSDSFEITGLADAVFEWGVARNITSEGGATSLSQTEKLKEEVQELIDSLTSGNREESMDAVGDILVVLLQICRLANFDIVECLGMAYHEIKDRKGRMENGVFIKEAK